MESYIDNPDVLNSWYSHEVYRCSRYSHGTTHYWLATKQPEVGDGIYNDAALTDQAGVVETASDHAFVFGGTTFTYDAGLDIYDKITSTTQAPSQSAVNQKYADNDLSNLTTAGGQVAAIASFPNGSSITQTVQESGHTYTIDRDCWVRAYGTNKTDSGSIGNIAMTRLANTTTGFYSDNFKTCDANGTQLNCNVPARKGDKVIFQYNAYVNSPTMYLLPVIGGN